MPACSFGPSYYNSYPIATATSVETEGAIFPVSRRGRGPHTLSWANAVGASSLRVCKAAFQLLVTTWPPHPTSRPLVLEPGCEDAMTASAAAAFAAYHAVQHQPHQVGFDPSPARP